MTTLSNPRHERFAQELAKGQTADAAYVAAGYKEHRGNAATLRANQSIQARVKALQSRGAELAEVTIESLISEAEQVRVAAMADLQLSAAIAAIKEKGILSGKRVERAETGKPGDFGRMADDELDHFIAERARGIGGGDRRTGGALGAPSPNGSGRLN